MGEHSRALAERATDGRRQPGRAVLAGLVLLALLTTALAWTQFAGDAAEGQTDEGNSGVASKAVPNLEDVELAATEGVGTDISVSPVVTYDVFLSRDPFEPVVPEEVATSTDGTDGTDGTGGEPDDPAVPTAPDPTRPPTLVDGEEVYCTGDLEVVCNGRVIVLLDTATSVDGERVAVVQVDTTVYEVEADDVFAGMFVVRSVAETSATFAFGDETFTLHLGTRVLK